MNFRVSTWARHLGGGICWLCVATAVSLSAQESASFTLSEALRTALEKNAQVQVSKEQLNVQKGVFRQAASQFDVNFAAEGMQAHTYRPLTGYESFQFSQYDQFSRNSVNTETSKLTLSASKELRNGVVLQPVIYATRAVDDLTNRIGYEQGGIHFNVTVPLLRGRGRTVVTANQSAAAMQVDEAVLQVDQTVSNTFAAVASSYWNVIAAEDEVELLRESEGRSDALIAAAQSLIKADRMPRSDLSQMEADKEIRHAGLLAAEQRLADMRQQLMLRMGVGVNGAVPERIPGVLPKVPAPEEIPGGPEAEQQYIRYALGRRADLQAMKEQKDAAQLITKAAKNALRPELNVIVSSGLTGLDEGTSVDKFLLSPAHSARGLDMTAGFTYRFPPARDYAGGSLEQAAAAERQSDLLYQDLARQIGLRVGAALTSLRISAEQARSTEASLRFSRQSLEAETERLRGGVGSTINVITLEDRLTAATESDLQARLAYAQALVSLRLATSTIVAPTAGGGFVDGDVFLNLPALPKTATAAKRVQP